MTLPTVKMHRNILTDEWVSYLLDSGIQFRKKNMRVPLLRFPSSIDVRLTESWNADISEKVAQDYHQVF